MTNKMDVMTGQMDEATRAHFERSAQKAQELERLQKQEAKHMAELHRGSPDWRSNFDERERKEIEWCLHYRNYYGHGTDGHNRMILLAKLVCLVDQLTRDLNEARSNGDTSH